METSEREMRRKERLSEKILIESDIMVIEAEDGIFNVHNSKHTFERVRIYVIFNERD